MGLAARFALMQPEHIQNFQERLNQWVAKQGFWFQIRHSVFGGGFGGKLMYHVFRMSLRLALFLLLLTIGSWIYLIKRTDSQAFRKSLDQSLRDTLSLTDLALNPSRNQNQLEITRLGAEGSPGSFFSSLEARNIRCRMLLTDGLYGVWDPGVISIASLDADLRAGADDAASASRMEQVIFSRPEKILVHSLDVSKANLRWGYSPRTRGSITSSHLKVQRTETGWRLILEGGTFNQNWLRDLDIIRMTVLCEPNGLVFEEAKLRKNKATVDFSGLRVDAGERPKIHGQVRIKNLDLESALPLAHQPLFSGTFSSELTVTGSTNSSEGISFEGLVSMDGTDVITLLHQRIHLLQALSVVDYSRNYHRVDFTEGSFQLKSGGGGLHLRNINLRAEELLTLEGELAVRLPSNDEVRAAIEKGLIPNSSESFGAPIANPLGSALDDSSFSLKRAANAAKHLKDGAQTGESMTIFDRLGLSVEMRKLEIEAAERLSRMLRYQGSFLITLPADAFERAPGLRKKYPVNLDLGRIPMRIPIDGYLDELTLPLAESVYEDGQR